ncbi:MAG: helix-turn-helix domain-containing protein [bacterium]|nr:helix-turn-helix domain-containing protein [bacterium]
MTQEALAECLCLDTQYYAQLERGERNFTIEKIINICRIFEIGIQDIIEINAVKEDSEKKETLIRSITDSLSELNINQLLSVEKFLTNIIPYTK